MPLRALATAAFLTALLAAASAGAETLLVDDPGDDPDASPGDGVCLTAADVCTLRAAVDEADALPGEDLIAVPPGTYDLQLSLVLSGQVEVTGIASVRDAVVIATEEPIGLVSADFFSNVTLKNLRLEGGEAFRGASVHNPGGTVTLDNVHVVGGHATDRGGCLNNEQQSTMTIRNSLIEGCSSPAGAIHNLGTATIENSVFQGNIATAIGGAIYNPGGKLTIDRVRFTGNDGTFTAGAIAANFTTLDMDHVLFDENQADMGAAVQLVGGDATIANATFFHNTARSFDILALFAGAEATLRNVTFAGNLPGIGVDVSVQDATLSLFNSVVPIVELNPLLATLAGTGHNLIDIDAESNYAAGPGDQLGVDAQMGALEKNGGPFPSVAPLPGSPAIDGGSTSAPGADDACESDDARGVPRDLGVTGDCDIGALEQTDCQDGLDNDGDGQADAPDDTGCSSKADLSETPDCSDGLDNDQDGFTDFPDDPDCQSAADTDEARIRVNGCQCGNSGLFPAGVAWLLRRRRRRALRRRAAS